MEIIRKYFPLLTGHQYEQLRKLGPLYNEWNTKINIISRKDIDNLYEHHILHSLSIAKFVQFKKKTLIMDAGTGGGFPGIPLAIIFPDTKFHLVDSIKKKLKVVKAIADEIELENITTKHSRIELVDNKYDFVISRAVVSLPKFYEFVCKKISANSFNDIANGILYLKGGDCEKELEELKKRYTIYELSEIFDEEYYNTKKLIHIY